MVHLLVPLGDYSVRPRLGFSFGLMDSIAASKETIQKWVDIEKKRADDKADFFHERLMEEQNMIDSKVARFDAVQEERGLSQEEVGNQHEAVDGEEQKNIAARKTRLEETKQFLEGEVEQLKVEYASRENRVKEVAKEEKAQDQKASEARSMKARMEKAKQTTVDDLTRGIVSYKHLGLDFEKTGHENELRFFFSQLDQSDPERQFSFVLQVDAGDRYEIAQCEPVIESTTLTEIETQLNSSDDMSFLVRKMREAFLKTM